MSNESLLAEYTSVLAQPEYLPEATFSVPFYQFALQYNSLQRYWALWSAHEQRIVTELKALPIEAPVAEGMLRSENVEVDIRSFPEYLRFSVLSIALVLAEDLLRALMAENAPVEGEELRRNVSNDGLSLSEPFTTTLAVRLRQMQGATMGSASPQERAMDKAALRAVLTTPAATFLNDLIEMVDKLAAEAKAEGAVRTIEDVDVDLHHLSQLVKACEKAYIAHLAKGHN